MLVLLDRDGVLNEDRPDYVKNPAELKLIPGVAAAVAQLNAMGHKVAIVTNQACVGKGIITQAMLEQIHQSLLRMLAAEGGKIDAILVCTDTPQAPTYRRKPKPGMLLEAMEQFHMSPQDTIMIGDDLRDLEAARAAGCARMLVLTGKGQATRAAGYVQMEPVVVCADLHAAVQHICNRGTGA